LGFDLSLVTYSGPDIISGDIDIPLIIFT